MKINFIFVIILSLFFVSNIYAQTDSPDTSSNELNPNRIEIIILFVVAILFVIGIGLYISREVIRRKKTDYDKEDHLSQKNRDFEKYHSEWTDEYVSSESKSQKIDDEFRKASEDSSLPNYYNVLGVSKDATHDQIKKRYRDLAKELHPDKSLKPDTEDQMAEINKAYEVLSDDERRKRYDKFLNIS